MRNYCGHVPVAVIAPYVRRWADEYSAEHNEVGKNQNSSAYVEPRKGEGALEILGFQAGVSGRYLRRILDGTVQGGHWRRAGGRKIVDYITFDTADKIITTIDPWLWHTEPELAKYYGPLHVTYGELKSGYELPEDFDFDSLPQAKKYVWLNARQRMAA